MTAVHPTAIVAPGAELADDVEIGPYCVVGENVRLDAGVRLHSHVVVDGHTSVGAGVAIFPFASIGTQTQDLKFDGAVTHVQIGERTVLREYVTVNSGTHEGEVTRVGRDCLIMAYSHVAHLCDVGDGVIMANAATLAGHVTVGDRAVIGGLSGVHQFVRIGAMSIVGGCSKVVKDVPPYMMADGHPAKIHGLNSVGLRRRKVPEESRRALKRAHRILWRESLSTRHAIQRIAAELGGCPEIDHLLEFLAGAERGISQ